MRLNIGAKGLEIGAAERERVERRMTAALGRFGDSIGEVSVRLIDTNGPRGGVDKQCRVVAEVVGRGRTVVVDIDADLNTVIDRVADRVGHTVSRRLDGPRGHWARRPARPAYVTDEVAS